MFRYDPTDDSAQPRGNADLHNSGFSFLGMARGLRRVSSLNHQFSSLIQKDTSCFGQLHTALVARKECDTQILLELTDLTAQRRLGDVQLLRGPAKVEVFGDGKEIANVTQFHGPVFYTRRVLLRNLFPRQRSGPPILPAQTNRHDSVRVA
jgi:hypothetical protein